MVSEDLLKKAVDAFNDLSPEQQAEMLEEQRRSWVRGNVGLSRDERGMTSPMMRALKIVRETNDKGRQALQAWADSKTRPTPVAPVSPDATGKCGELVANVWALVKPDGNLVEVTRYASMANLWRERGYHPAEYVTRSQAEEILAAKDDECKYLKSTLSAWFDTKKITEDSLKPHMVAAVKGYLRTCSSGGMPQELIDEVLPAVECMIDYGVFTESVTQYTMSLKADNAALTARVKELDSECNELVAKCNEIIGQRDNALNTCAQMEEDKEALEAKLAAAEKALEPFAEHANDRAVDDTGWRDKETVKIVVSIGDLRKARAALGGKPS